MTKGNIKKQIIIDATIELISERGVAGTSLAHISQKVGISKGTLYYYYSSKNDLIFEITQAHMDGLTDSLFAIIRENKGKVSWQEMLKKLFNTVIKSETRTRLHIYLIQEIISGNSKLKAHFSETYKKWFELLKEAYNLITDKNDDMEIQARIFVAAIDGFIIQHIIGADEIPIDEVVENLSVIIGE
ncbi:MAG: TetR/AcrR family transcriptional regulator [Desulfobacterales bacterium]|nr:TetR/AcrR family transcriptional regulator [Desulfobacterales bacterium]MCP4162638.1 TetR/AcrR family transcriptional regulator [Deltaproteobacteria bacterium]